MKPALALSTFTLLAASLLGVTPATAADEPPVTVTWPEVTRFNPDHTSYDVTISDPAGTGTLVAWWAAGQQVLPHEGSASFDFQRDGHLQVVITRCPEGYAGFWQCTEVARSPELDVYSRLTVYGEKDLLLPPGPALARFGYGPADVAQSIASAHWELVDRKDPGRVYASGSSDEPPTPDNDGFLRAPFTIPDDLASGSYRLRVQVSAETADFGHIEGDTGYHPIKVTVDSDAPVLTVPRTPRTIYPANDGYLDALDIFATTDEPATGILEIRDSSGSLVSRTKRLTDRWDDVPSFHWSALGPGHEILPEDTYSLDLTVTDQVGHQSSWHGSVAVSHQRLQWETFRRTVTAVDSLVGKPFVGRCSTLERSPRGRLAYYSQSRCAGSPRAGAVATSHGMYIPNAFRNIYRWVRVTLDGGPATASAHNYLVMGYRNAHTNELIETRVFRGSDGDGPHTGVRVRRGRGVIFDRSADQPYLIWSNGLTAGSRYVVRRYTVEVMYRVLR